MATVKMNCSNSNIHRLKFSTFENNFEFGNSKSQADFILQLVSKNKTKLCISNETRKIFHLIIFGFMVRFFWLKNLIVHKITFDSNEFGPSMIILILFLASNTGNEMKWHCI